MKYEDLVVTEVRQNREALLAEFNGDAHRLNEHLIAQQSIVEAVGVHYETNDERQTRIAWRRQQEEVENRRVAGL